MVSGVCSDALMTTLLPVASAGRKTLRQNHQRMIERRHQRDDAERHALRVAQVRAFDRNHVAAARQRERREIAVELRQTRNLRACLARSAGRCSTSRADKSCSRSASNRIGETIQHARALLDRQVAPRAAFERAMARVHRAVHILFRRRRERANHVTGRRIDDIERRGRSRRPSNCAVDEKLCIEMAAGSPRPSRSILAWFTLRRRSMRIRCAPHRVPASRRAAGLRDAWSVGSTPSHATTTI